MSTPSADPGSRRSRLDPFRWVLEHPGQIDAIAFGFAAVFILLFAVITGSIGWWTLVTVPMVLAAAVCRIRPGLGVILIGSLALLHVAWTSRGCSATPSPSTRCSARSPTASPPCMPPGSGPGSWVSGPGRLLGRIRLARRLRPSRPGTHHLRGTGDRRRDHHHRDLGAGQPPARPSAAAGADPRARRAGGPRT